MTMSDRIVSVVAVACLAFSLGILGWFVPDIDLIIVLTLVIGLTVYDFFIYRADKS
jgi:hypothetical protein